MLKDPKDTRTLKPNSSSAPTAPPVRGLRRRCLMYLESCACVCAKVFTLSFFSWCPPA